MPDGDDSNLIDVSALADLLGVRPNTVYRWLHRYDETRLPHYKIGHLVRFDTREIDDWLADQHRPGVLGDESTHQRPGT